MDKARISVFPLFWIPLSSFRRFAFLPFRFSPGQTCGIGVYAPMNLLSPQPQDPRQRLVRGQPERPCKPQERQVQRPEGREMNLAPPARPGTLHAGRSQAAHRAGNRGFAPFEIPRARPGREEYQASRRPYRSLIGSTSKARLEERHDRFLRLDTADHSRPRRP